MPKATAVWLVDRTALTFEQIADFCGLHPLEVQSLADGDVSNHVVGHDPVLSGQLSAEDIALCEKDPQRRLELQAKVQSFLTQKRKQKGRYTPMARRQDKPDAVAWILKNFPTMSDTQIVRLIGTTKQTIESIRTRTHWNAANIRPRDPVLLGLCSQADLDLAVRRLEVSAIPADSLSSASWDESVEESFPSSSEKYKD
jgi:hypothetical protein